MRLIEVACLHQGQSSQAPTSEHPQSKCQERWDLEEKHLPHCSADSCSWHGPGLGSPLQWWTWYCLVFCGICSVREDRDCQRLVNRVWFSGTSLSATSPQWHWPQCQICQKQCQRTGLSIWWVPNKGVTQNNKGHSKKKSKTMTTTKETEECLRNSTAFIRALLSL